MFERTAVRRPTDITGLAGFDTGALAESLLFYGTTSLVLDPGSLKDILRSVGVDSVVRLAWDDAVRVFYAPNMTTIPNAGSLPAAGWGLSTVSINFEPRQLVELLIRGPQQGSHATSR